MIKTVFFTAITLVFFYIIWFYNPFVHREKYEVPQQYMSIINDYSKYAQEGRQLFQQNCQACHSVRYDALYLASVEANPNLPALKEKYGKVLPRDVYEATFHSDLMGLKESFGKVPPDLSTIYLSRDVGYLYNFILEPYKVLPGTSMPAVIEGRPEDAAKIVAYLRSVSEPSPQEKTKRTIMGVGTIAYLVVMGALLYLWRKKKVKEMGLE